MGRYLSLARLGQVVAVIALATIGKPETRSIAVNVSNLIGLFSGANAFFPEAGESDQKKAKEEPADAKEGFTTALWRQSKQITTADCRGMIQAAGFLISWISMAGRTSLCTPLYKRHAV